MHVRARTHKHTQGSQVQNQTLHDKFMFADVTVDVPVTMPPTNHAHWLHIKGYIPLAGWFACMTTLPLVCGLATPKHCKSLKKVVIFLSTCFLRRN